MRYASDRLLQLYKSSPIFQDLLETAGGTAIAAGGQALLTDMTPEEIAIASAAGFGAGMVGRPIVGRLGQTVGKHLDTAYPRTSEVVAETFRSGKGMEMYPEFVRDGLKAKMEPFKDLGGYSQVGQLLGRGYGDNLAQLAVALAAPGLLGSEEEIVV